MIDEKHWHSLNNIERSRLLEINFPIAAPVSNKKNIAQGVGVNDASYIVNKRCGSRRFICPAYSSWSSMLCRCYSDKSRKNNMTYDSVVVCDDWLSFSSFREWWLDNQVDGWQLDKDLLSGSRVYSPETCIFVPAWLNTFTIDRGGSRGESMIGARFHAPSGKFQARCNNPITGKCESLGYHTKQEEASKAWLERKVQIANDLVSEMDKIDSRIYQRVLEIIRSAK